jgi:hypothetical protein
MIVGSMIIEITATALAAFATAASGLIAARFAPSRKQLVSTANSQNNDPEEESRISDARCELNRQETRAKWSRCASALLTFAQYVIGGILASSFVQKSLTSDTVGFLGVTVLFSSLVHQRYRPDVQFRCAKGRAANLRNLIRVAEDDLFAIREQRDGAPTVFDIRKRISECLARIDDSEIAELDEQSNANDGA